MRQSRIPVRYAKAIFSMAKEKGILEPVRNDMELIFNTCSTVTELSAFLSSPVIGTSGKKKVLLSIFGKSVHEVTKNFLKLLTDNKREVCLVEIARYFMTLYRKEKNIISVVLTTARPVDDATKERITGIIRESFKANVELHGKVKEEIVGGFILRIDDMQYDAGISSKLKEVKRDLINTAFEQKVSKTSEQN